MKRKKKNIVFENSSNSLTNNDLRWPAADLRKSLTNKDLRVSSLNTLRHKKKVATRRQPLKLYYLFVYFI